MNRRQANITHQKINRPIKANISHQKINKANIPHQKKNKPSKDNISWVKGKNLEHIFLEVFEHNYFLVLMGFANLELLGYRFIEIFLNASLYNGTCICIHVRTIYNLTPSNIFLFYYQALHLSNSEVKRTLNQQWEKIKTL